MGTVSDRSRAALRVTVTITRVTPSETLTLRDEPDEMVDSAAGVPANLPCRADCRNRLCGDERCAPDQPTSSEHPHFTDSLTPDNRKLQRRAPDDPLDERLPDAHRPNDVVARDEPDRGTAVARLGDAVRATTVDRLDP